MNKETTTKSRLKILRTGDQKSQFYYNRSPKEVLQSLGYPRYLLSTSTKTQKSEGVRVLQRVLYLSPGCLCPSASTMCLAQCLGHSSGRMVMHSEARDRRTALYYEDQDYFMRILQADLQELRVEANARDMIPCARLNGTSDIPWEKHHGEIFESNPDIVFMDYTKIARRVMSYLSGTIDGKRKWPSNYSLTFSRSETTRNHQDAKQILAAGGNVAVVFDRVPRTWHGYRVINGDAHDARFLDPQGVIVGLKAKGEALNDEGGFVVRAAKAETWTPWFVEPGLAS